MSYSPSTRTTLDVATSVKRTFGDESGVQITDSDILGWINEAQEEIVKRNKVLKASASTLSTPGQGTYTFPSQNILELASLHYDGSKLDNVPFVEAENDFISSDNANDSGTPQAWWEWGGTFTLWPTPDSAATITLYYTQRPDQVTTIDSNTTLDLPDKYFKQVVDFVLQQAYELDEAWDASQAKAQQFDNALQQMSDEERTASNMTYPVVSIVY